MKSKPISDRRQTSNTRLRLSFQLLWWEGAFAMAFDTWVGPTYLSGLAGELGLSIGLVSLLAAMPWIGAVGPLLGAWIHGNRRVSSPRASTLAFTLIARGLWLLPLLLAGLWSLSAQPFPAQRWFVVTAVVACMAAFTGTSGGALWMSWMRGLIPSQFRGRFFGVRNRHVMIANVIAHFLAASYIAWKPGGFFLGYAGLGLLAVFSASLSTFLLAKVPDAPADAAGPAQGKGHEMTLGSFLEPLRDPSFRGVLVFGAAFQGAIQLASSFYPYYFTSELHYPMSLVASWTALNSAGCFVAAGFWGRKVDRTGAAIPLAIAAFFVALSPLPYVFCPDSLMRWMAPFEYFSNGLYAVGYGLAMSSLLLERTPRGRNVTYFAVYTACAGIMAAIGSLAGGWIARELGGFRTLWAIAGACRMLVYLALIRLVLPLGLRAAVLDFSARARGSRASA